MARLFEYFVVCGLGPDIHTLDGMKGYQGMDVKYMPSFLDQFPPTNASLPPPPQLPTCVLPAGVGIYISGFELKNSSSHPKSYPIVLTEGDGSKVYVSCISFRDPVSEDIAGAYQIPCNSYADKCICLISRSPSFRILRDALEELFSLCFSSVGSSKPIWDIIAHMVMNIPLPMPGKGHILFSIETCLFSVDSPALEGLPHVDISFQPLVRSLDVHNLIRLFTAILLERRILLRSRRYSLLTLVSEALCHLIYPFRWQHVYIPVLFFSGVDYIDAPTPYMMGLHSDVDTSSLAMDGVVVVDLECNQITTSEEIPSIPQPELAFLHGELMKLLYPDVINIDKLRVKFGGLPEQSLCDCSIHWGEEHDTQLRFIFLRFFALILKGYRKFIEHTVGPVFNVQAFLKERIRMSLQPEDPMIAQFLDSQGFLDYLERILSSAEGGMNLLDMVQDAIIQGIDPCSVLPSPSINAEILTVRDQDGQSAGNDVKYCYKQFPSHVRSEEQERRRKAILDAACGGMELPRHIQSSLSTGGERFPIIESLSPRERAAERERMVLDIKVKLQGLWVRLLRLEAIDDPLSSFEYGTILALIESDAEGIGGSGLIECIREHLNSGWSGLLTGVQFIAVKELLKTAISRAVSRNDMPTIRDALEVSAEIHTKDTNSISDYVQRHLQSLPIWDEISFWEGYFECLMELSVNKSSNYTPRVTGHLILLLSHMVGLGLPDVDAWQIIEGIAGKNNIGHIPLIKLRGCLSHIQLLHIGYWGPAISKTQPISSAGLLSRSQETAVESQQAAEASGIGRSWVQSMFTRNRSSRTTSINRVQQWTSKNDISVGTIEHSKHNSAKKVERSNSIRKTQHNLRLLHGHKGPVTVLHCVTRREVWDLASERDDAGFFISGSTDCMVKLWDPSLRGSEDRATLQGHTGPVRAINSDRTRVISGSDDHSVLIWDKHTSQLLQELNGHEGVVIYIRLLSGERVITASHDGKIKMWDARTDKCAADVGLYPSAILCVDYNDSTGILVAAGRDSAACVWDIRAGRQVHKFVGHSKWIRCISMLGDTVITGSDDWTARMWSISRGSCDAVLACHSGTVLCVETLDNSIITGSADGQIRFWEKYEDGIRCLKNVTQHSTSIISISATDHWLGIGASDNYMSLFHRPQGRHGNLVASGVKMGWQLYRTPERMPAMVRCMVADLERKRMCSGGCDGAVRLWEATINI